MCFFLAFLYVKCARHVVMTLTKFWSNFDKILIIFLLNPDKFWSYFGKILITYMYFLPSLCIARLVVVILSSVVSINCYMIPLFVTHHCNTVSSLYCYIIRSQSHLYIMGGYVKVMIMMIISMTMRWCIKTSRKDDTSPPCLMPTSSFIFCNHHHHHYCNRHQHHLIR